MHVEYHLFKTRPLEKCLFDSEEICLPVGVPELFYVVNGLRTRILDLTKKTQKTFQGYAFIDRIPAVLIRSDGSIHLLERYNRVGGEALNKVKAIEALPFQ